MKILSYHEVKDKDSMMVMGLKSFFWAFTPGWLDDNLRQDEFLRDSPIGMCAVSGGKVVSFVGVTHIKTKNKSGDIETAGGIHSVMTLPDYAGKGFARKLLQAAESYFMEQGFRFSFLTTSSFINAYKWYLDVGYKDIPQVLNYPYLYKVFKKPQVEPVTKTPSEFKLNHKAMLEIFNRYAENKSGFTYRTIDLIKFKESSGAFVKHLSLMLPDGYALLTSVNNSIVIKEILANSQKAYSKLIKMASLRAKYGIAAQHPYDPNAVKALIKAGFKLDKGNYIKAMCKPQGKDTLNDVYGKNFMISKIDWF